VAVDAEVVEEEEWKDGLRNILKSSVQHKVSRFVYSIPLQYSVFPIVNSVLNVRVYKQYAQTCGPYSSQLSNVSVEVYDNPTCEGEPVQEGMAETWSALFLTKVENTKQWSVLAKKEGYKGACQNIGIMVPFKENYGYAYLVEDVENTEIIPWASLNLTYKNIPNFCLTSSSKEILIFAEIIHMDLSNDHYKK
jgi:hypothetical protein